MAYLMRTVPHEALAARMLRTDAAVWGAAVVLDLPPGMGEYGADMDGPLRHGGLGLRMQSEEVSNAAFVAGTGQAEHNLKGHPAVLCPLQGASGALVRERWSNLHEWYAGLCGWDAAAKDLPTDFLDSR